MINIMWYNFRTTNLVAFEISDFGGTALRNNLRRENIMKKKVRYAELEDMQRYIEGFNPDDYEKTWDYTDPSVIEYAREYYDNHLPVNVTAWMRVNEPASNLIYADGLREQVSFIRDTINYMLNPSYEEGYKNEPLVISTHKSKSVKLPVFQINLKKYGIELVLRYNFYNWKVSVKSEKPLNFDFMGLFNPSERIHSIYCEGFPKDKVYGCFKENPAQFTIRIESHFELYTFFFLLKNYLTQKRY